LTGTALLIEDSSRAHKKREALTEHLPEGTAGK